jgi:hypothetical protein
LLGANRPAAWWRGEGNAHDSAGDNNGFPIRNVSYGNGLRGSSFLFEGEGNYVKIPPSSKLDPGSELTIEFWMKADAESLKAYSGLIVSDFYLVEISNGQHGRMGINFGISTDNGASLAQTADANNGGQVVSPNCWHMIDAVYDGHKLQLYVDGQLSGKPEIHSGVISPMRPDGFLAVGSEDGRTTRPHCIGTRYFNGLIDEVKIFRRALSPDRIKANYASLEESAR